MVKFLSRGKALLQTLTEPASSITDPVSSRRARLLAALLLAFTFVFVINLPIRILADPGYLQRSSYVPLVAAAMFLAVYGLSRTKHVQAASLFALLLFFSMIVYVVGSAPQPLGITLDYFAWLVLLGSLLLSLRGTFLLSLISIVTILILGLLVLNNWELTLNAYYFTSLMFLFIVVAAAIRHQDMHSLAQRRRALALQSRVGAAAAASLELEKVLEVACEELVLIFKTPRATAYMLDNDICRVAAEYNADGDRPNLGHQFPRSECPVIGLLLEQESPVAITQAQHDPRIAAMHDSMVKQGVASFLFLPLVVRGDLIGAIRLDSVEQRKYSDEELLLASETIAVVGRAVEHAMLFTDERQARQLSDTLQEIAQALNLAPDLDTALDLVLAHMEQVIAFDSGSILLLEENRIRVGAVRGFDQPELELNKTFSLDLALLNREVVETRRPLMVASVADDSRWLGPVENGRLSEHLHEIHAWIGVPLLIQDRVIGMLTAEKREPDFYKPSDAELAMAFAGHAAVAIENARLLELERAQLRLSQTLQDVGALLTTRLSLDDVFERIFDLLSQVVDYDTVSIQLLNAQGELELKVGRGFGDFSTILQSSDLLARKTPQEEWLERRVLVVPDTRKYVHWEPFPGSEHIFSWVGVALMAKGELIGVLNVDSATPNLYNDEIGNTITLFANQAAVAIENARLYDQAQKELTERKAIQLEYERLLNALERRSNWLQTAAQVSTASNAILEPKVLMQQAVNLIQQRFDFYYVGIFLVDESEQRAVLQAGSGDAGRQMVQMQHKLMVGGESMIGWSVDNAQARIALDVGQEAVRFENPLLPETRSEMALPLLSRGRCIGGLTVQSSEEAAFSEDDIVALQSMADHLATAIDNARLYKEAQTEIEMRKRAEAEVKELNENLEQMVAGRTEELITVNRELESFAYSVSHDLRAPLRRVTSFSRALQEDYAHHLDSVGQDYLQRIESSGTKMAHLIEALLNMSRLSRREIRRQEVNLSAIAQEVMEEFCLLYSDRAIELEIEKDLIVCGDAQLLRIAMENLLGNACKFTANTAEALIEFGSLWHREDEAAFFVRDNGAGFDMAYADMLFTAFRRLHTISEFEGTGIGLATVQRIIRRHGGRVWAEGAVGQGATFCFTIKSNF